MPRSLPEIIETLNSSAQNYLKQSPENQKLFPEMLESLLRGAEVSQEQMDSFVLMYVLNESYPRSDIMLATGAVKRENGWH